MTKRSLVAVVLFVSSVASSCGTSKRARESQLPLPRQIIDLSPTITEDLPVRVWGHRALKDFGFSDTTEFRVIQGDEPLYFSDSYRTLFNHAGPHIDAPNHLQRGVSGVDGYKLESLVGPIRLLDIRGPSVDDSVTLTELKKLTISPGDIVVTLTGYVPPKQPDEVPEFRVLSKEAAEYLAQVPVKALVTDGLSVDSFRAIYRGMEQGLKGYEALAPVHHALLTKGIPAIEQLTNVEALVGIQRAVFVGLPLKVKEGDASPIRATAFVY